MNYTRLIPVICDSILVAMLVLVILALLGTIAGQLQ